MTPARVNRRAAVAALVAVTALGLVTCRPRVTPRPAAGATPPPWVLVINGGGTKAGNYRSHLLHVQELLGLLDRAGVPPARITVFSSDGDDPEPDLATRDGVPPKDFWLLRGTPLERPLAPPVAYANTAVPGMALRPARKDALAAWFAEARTRLGPGDTLLVYVTDHGSKNKDDPRNNSITLWGKDEELSVNELRALLAELDPGVRVVSLMSQCFSGAFARLGTPPEGDGEPRGQVCGYFSSTEDRPAYGCYPENRGKDNVGFSFHFFEALTASARFPEAHARTLVTDRTPDVPLRSSDLYLDEVLRRAAKAAGEEPTAFIDARLAEAWTDRAAWEPEIRLLDRIAQAFGIFSPRSLGEIERQETELPEISTQLRSQGRAWHEALGDLAQVNLQRFLDAEPSWRDRTAEVVLASYQPEALGELTADLLGDLRPFTERNTTTHRRLQTLRKKDKIAADAAYRMEVRVGAVLRMRLILERIAGRVYLATRGTPAERAAYEALLACEDFSPGPTEGAEPSTRAAHEPFPPFQDDVALAQQTLPAWMGINFRPANEADRKRLGLGDGAATVLAVYPDSPAKEAGLAAGDFVLGPPGQPFTEPRQIREWVMLSAVDQPVALDVRRGDESLRLSLTPKPYPLKWPTLPGPPKAGTSAPPLKLSRYRGHTPERLASGSPHLLFFWATWCGPCKAAVPELLAYAAERRTEVVAITDEPAETLDRFFQKWTKPFPETVAMDVYRGSFFAYGVTGTPAFVLVDGKGIVQGHAIGYSEAKGLDLAGWTWAKRSTPPAP